MDRCAILLCSVEIGVKISAFTQRVTTLWVFLCG